MKRNDPPLREVYVCIEKEGRSKFKIQSDQLEQIGTQLRGPKKFPVFHSIILPAIVSFFTFILTSFFQYVSWSNSVNLQNATEMAANAERTYEKAAAAIGRRHYAMLVFLPSLRDLARAKPSIEANVVPDPESTPQHAIAMGPPLDIPLLKSDLDNKQRRFSSYYEQLKLWNENYDYLLHDIDYTLDRPVFRQADKTSERKVLSDRFNRINCFNSLTKEFQKLDLDPNSLKFRFAGINKCFRDTHKLLDQQLDKAISVGGHFLIDTTDPEISNNLNELLDKENVFRCYARQRIEYYNRQKELSILSIRSIWRGLTDAQKGDAEEHLKENASSCAESS
ncbi:MAG TPA: hypothetical protein VNZ53_31605 [Steroidobacteraceae bacterium]|jgi:hypothetical protein|nr:hypothetical protein [Steroidobacteraceae bacterium]